MPQQHTTLTHQKKNEKKTPSDARARWALKHGGLRRVVARRARWRRAARARAVRRRRPRAPRDGPRRRPRVWAQFAIFLLCNSGTFQVSEDSDFGEFERTRALCPAAFQHTLHRTLESLFTSLQPLPNTDNVESQISLPSVETSRHQSVSPPLSKTKVHKYTVVGRRARAQYHQSDQKSAGECCWSASESSAASPLRCSCSSKSYRNCSGERYAHRPTPSASARRATGSSASSTRANESSSDDDDEPSSSDDAPRTSTSNTPAARNLERKNEVFTPPWHTKRSTRDAARVQCGESHGLRVLFGGLLGGGAARGRRGRRQLARLRLGVHGRELRRVRGERGRLELARPLRRRDWRLEPHPQLVRTARARVPSRPLAEPQHRVRELRLVRPQREGAPSLLLPQLLRPRLQTFPLSPDKRVSSRSSQSPRFIPLQ